MITLGGVVLSNSIVWTDRFSEFAVAQLRKRTLGGKQVISYASLLAGVPITLESGEEYGWMTKATIEQIFALSEVGGVAYPFVWAGETHQVLFRHDDPPAVQFRPLIPRKIHDSTDWFIGTIKLVTV